MRRYRIHFYLNVAFMLLFVSVSSIGHAQVATLPDIDTSGAANGIVPFPPGTPDVFADTFTKYTKLVAPNGKPIHFIVQDAWSDDQILKARNIMEHILTDYPGSRYGDNKAVVANSMGNKKATMTLFNTSATARDWRRGSTDLFTQSLWATETTAEGTDDYMNHATRDAAYEEVLHLVQGSGIIPTLTEYQAQIKAAEGAATATGWGPPNDQPNEWHYEYFAQLLDIYLDLWVVQPTKWEGTDLAPGEMPEGTAHRGQNQSNSREELMALDPVGFGIVEQFFHPYLTYTPLMPIDFEGTFSIKLDKSKSYTYKSQHLRNVTLRGENNVSLTGNRHANVLTGNAGKNTLSGGGGDDRLNGNQGQDTAVFSGTREEYAVTRKDGYVTVRDTRLNRDGADTLTSIELLQFSDGKVEL